MCYFSKESLDEIVKETDKKLDKIELSQSSQAIQTKQLKIFQDFYEEIKQMVD